MPEPTTDCLAETPQLLSGYRKAKASGYTPPMAVGSSSCYAVEPSRVASWPLSRGYVHILCFQLKTLFEILSLFPNHRSIAANKFRRI